MPVPRDLAALNKGESKMNTYKENPWWQIFSSDNKSLIEETCPVVPVHSGQAWQKELAVLYCPCKSDPQAEECQLPLI